MSKNVIGSAIEEYQAQMAADKVSLSTLGSALHSVNFSGGFFSSHSPNAKWLTHNQNPKVVQLEEAITNYGQQQFQSTFEFTLPPPPR